MADGSAPAVGGRDTGDSPRAGTVPSPELVERFRQFEARVDDAVRLIGELRREKRGLEARLDEAARARAEAAQRIDVLLDKIDGLL
jgi:phage host-nuclease inhibitor protein Gam